MKLLPLKHFKEKLKSNIDNYELLNFMIKTSYFFLAFCCLYCSYFFSFSPFFGVHVGVYVCVCVLPDPTYHVLIS